MLVELRLIKRQTRIFMSSKNSKSYFTQKKYIYKPFPASTLHRNLREINGTFSNRRIDDETIFPNQESEAQVVPQASTKANEKNETSK